MYIGGGSQHLGEQLLIDGCGRGPYCRIQVMCLGGADERGGAAAALYRELVGQERDIDSAPRTDLAQSDSTLIHQISQITQIYPAMRTTPGLNGPGSFHSAFEICVICEI